MKRTVLLFFIAFLCITAHLNAQITKGSTLITGSIAGVSSKTDYLNGVGESKQSSISVPIGIGKAIHDNLIIGVLASYQRVSNDGVGSDVRKTNQYGGGAFIRQYQPLGKSGFYLYGHGSISATFGKTIYNQNSPSQTTEKTTDLRLALAPGLAYSVNNWLQLQTGLNDLFYFNYQTSKTSTVFSLSSKSKGFSGGVNFSGGNQLFIGFNILINRRASS